MTTAIAELYCRFQVYRLRFKSEPVFKITAAAKRDAILILKNKNGVLFYQFEHMTKVAGLFQGIFTRRGGVSPAPFDSLNVG